MESKRITNCTFSFRCPQLWDELVPTESKSIKFCKVCDRGVYLAEDEEAVSLLAAAGKCVAIRQHLVEENDTSTDPNSPFEPFLLGVVDRADDGPTWPLFLECAHDALRGNAPGYVLNNNKPGSDGNYYSIERSHTKRGLWVLFQCVPQYLPSPSFIVSPIAQNISVVELYARIEAVGIIVEDHEAIALGLPFHDGNY